MFVLAILLPGGGQLKILDFGREVLGLTYSPLQQVVLLAARGEELTEEQVALFERHAGRPWPGPGEPPGEVHVVAGRQSGKTGYLAPTLILHAALDPETVRELGAGYWRDVVLVAPTQRQARIAYQRIRGLVEGRAELKRYLRGEPTLHELEFEFGVRLGIWAAHGAHLRGTQPRLVLLDEACWLGIEGPRADQEIVEAVRPGMALVPGAQVVTISTPAWEQGYVWETWRRRAEREDALVFQAASWELNPRFRQSFLDRERERDPDYFRREYGAEFVSTIQAYLPAASVEACVVRGRLQVAPVAEARYAAALDQGYRRDTFALAVGHREGGRVVVDRIRGWSPRRGQPVKLETLLPELLAELEPYRVHAVFGDQYAAEAFREVLRRDGLSYQERTFTSESKRDMYESLKALVVGGQVELLDHEASLRELRTLEARVAPSGAVKIEAPRGAGFSDDYADCLAILAHELRPSRDEATLSVGLLGGSDPLDRDFDSDEDLELEDAGSESVATLMNRKF